ncbi:3D domain-containing protein [Bacillus subtilis]|uniref:3D domain-containing protein n=1 Tax=Bacillus subtilis TaxID=1423 RepID=UPI00214A777F|nr:3D domain-containing protein [Bacillus subtilis]MCR1994606.1 3D domain-containing protein [Bacillus subtilis]
MTDFIGILTNLAMSTQLLTNPTAKPPEPPPPDPPRITEEEAALQKADGTTFEAVAQDTGGYIKGAKIDVLVADEANAVQFGRQSVQVRVIN